MNHILCGIGLTLESFAKNSVSVASEREESSRASRVLQDNLKTGWFDSPWSLLGLSFGGAVLSGYGAFVGVTAWMLTALRTKLSAMYIDTFKKGWTPLIITPLLKNGLPYVHGLRGYNRNDNNLGWVYKNSLGWRRADKFALRNLQNQFDALSEQRGMERVGN